MHAQRETGSTANLASRAGQDLLSNSVWQAPDLEISKIKSGASITAMSYRRGGGEAIWRSDRHRIVLPLADDYPTNPQVLV